MDADFWTGKRAKGVMDSVPESAQSILEVFDQAVNNFAGQPAFSCFGHPLSFTEVARFSRAFAAYLQQHTDLKAGDKIAIQLPNILQFPIVVFGALRLGLVLVNTNPLYTEREMRQQFTDAGVRAIVFLESLGHKLEAVIQDTPIQYAFVTAVADMLETPKRQIINAYVKYIQKVGAPFRIKGLCSFRKVLELGGELSLIAHSASADDLALLQYTGGTTGVAKGAMLSHRNLVSNMLQVKTVLLQMDEAGKPVFPAGEQTLIAPLPLYHIYAFTCHVMCMVSLGNHNVLIPNPRDIKSLIRLLKKQPYTGFVGLNTLFNALLSHPEFARCDFSRLRLTLSGGSALMDDTARRWQEVTGCQIAEAYGLTEASPAVCMNPLAGLAHIGTVGLPVPSTLLKTVDPKNGQETALGEPGELCVKGPQVMQGYWQKPAESALVLEEGWLKTGDVAVIQEDGFVRIVDRLKDVILVSGFNVFPNEIEDVVMTHPEVSLCAAIGVSDAKSDEVPYLFVISVPGSKLEENVLKRWCLERLVRYKVPRYFEFCKTLPMTQVGKVLRSELRKIVKKKLR